MADGRLEHNPGQTIRSVHDRLRLEYFTLTGPYCRIMARPVIRPHEPQDMDNFRSAKRLAYGRGTVFLDLRSTGRVITFEYCNFAVVPGEIRHFYGGIR